VIFGLPFVIKEFWRHFIISGKGNGAKKIFVLYSVEMRRLPNINILSQKRDKKFWRKADIIVALKISDTNKGEVLQAIISIRSVIMIRDIEWVDVGEKLLKYIACDLNAAEKTGERDVKKWHLNGDNIILIYPSNLIQHNIMEFVKKCVENIA